MLNATLVRLGSETHTRHRLVGKANISAAYAMLSHLWYEAVVILMMQPSIGFPTKSIYRDRKRV